MPRHESNVRTRFGKPLLYPLTRGGGLTVAPALPGSGSRLRAREGTLSATPQGGAHDVLRPGADCTGRRGACRIELSITIDGVEIAQFSELVELTSGLDPSTLTLTLDQKKGQAGLKKLPGKRTPPTVTLKRAMSRTWYLRMAQRRVERRGGRRSAVLATRDSQGRTISSYNLENVWPAKIEVTGLKAGASEVLYESVTFVCENIQRVNP